VVICICEKVVKTNCEKLVILNLLFTDGLEEALAPLTKMTPRGLDYNKSKPNILGRDKLLASRGSSLAQKDYYQPNHAYIPIKNAKTDFMWGKIRVDIAKGDFLDETVRKETYELKSGKSVTWCNQFGYDLTDSMGYGNPWEDKLFTNKDGNKQLSTGVDYRVNANAMNEIMNSYPDVFHEVSLNESWNYVNAGGMVYYSWNSGSSSSGHITTGLSTDELSTIEVNEMEYNFGNVVQAGLKVGKFPLLGEGGVYSDAKIKNLQAFVLIESFPTLSERLEYKANPLKKMTPKEISQIPNKPMNEPELKLR
ncbi:MAG: hypothetical protein JEZ09_01455, partial [Salinivirgaceae bacterium]|nr:hypothetical protein [Salinivirgaceae bacterium]